MSSLLEQGMVRMRVVLLERIHDATRWNELFPRELQTSTGAEHMMLIRVRAVNDAIFYGRTSSIRRACQLLYQCAVQIANIFVDTVESATNGIGIELETDNERRHRWTYSYAGWPVWVSDEDNRHRPIEQFPVPLDSRRRRGPGCDPI